MSWLKSVCASLTLLCLLCTPALAQSSPSSSQYEPCTPGSGSDACASSVHDSVEDVVDNAEKGTSAVNEAMDDAMDGGVKASVTGSSATSASASSSTENDTDAEVAAAEPGGITKLPETGGVPLAVLGLGLVLAALGLMSRKVVGR